MKPFFKPEDFEVVVSTIPKTTRFMTSQEVATKFNSLIDASPVAYGNSTQFDIVSKPTSAYTHSAVIMFIEEIPNKECVHTRIDSIRLADIGECHECGAVMVKEWRVK